MRSRLNVFSAVLGLALAVGLTVSMASAQTYWDPNAGSGNALPAAPPAVAQSPSGDYAPEGVTEAVPQGMVAPPADIGYQPAPIYAGLPGCPVSPYDLQNVLSGMYGVDALQRPLNAFGFPVDIYGRCLSYAPVTAVYNYMPAPVYIGYLRWHFGYTWYYRPGFVHLWGAPGVRVFGGYGAIPYGHTVVINRGYRPPVGTVINNHTVINQGGSVTTINRGPGTQLRTGQPALAPAAPGSLRTGPTAAPPAAVAPAVRPAQPNVAAPTGGAQNRTFGTPAAPRPAFNAPAAPRPSFTAPSRIAPSGGGMNRTFGGRGRR